jgi:catechol 2,3-dioxygenase-like lactoylglutathione lyase family enzyme
MDESLHVQGIDHLNLSVRDLEETCAFYRDLFGFKILEDIPEQSGRIIGMAHAMLAIYESPGMERYKKQGFAHFSLHIQNFEAIEARCAAMGIQIKYGGIVQWPRSRSIYIEDPNGYEIELVERWGGGLV